MRTEINANFWCFFKQRGLFSLSVAIAGVQVSNCYKLSVPHCNFNAMASEVTMASRLVASTIDCVGHLQ